jgi:hypothetical protein
MFGMDSGARGQLFGENQAQGAFGNQAANQIFNQQLTGANFQNTARQQQIAEEMQRRGFSLNEINAIISGQQVATPNMPQFNAANASQATNYSGAAKDQGQYNLDMFNAQQSGLSGTLSGLGSLAGGAAGMAMMFSDRRLKRNIKLIGSWRGHKVYSFNYIWGPAAIGVMADEVPASAVVRHSSGYDMVNYASL